MDTMKIDTALIKQLREQRAWSQEHLASVAGLSLRTVQRVEADGSASAETRMAIASALDVDVARLNMSSPLPAAEVIRPERDFKIARLHYRLLRFLIIGGLLVGVDVYSSGTITWSKWVILFWGVFLLLRIVKTYLVEPRPRANT